MIVETNRAYKLYQNIGSSTSQNKKEIIMPVLAKISYYNKIQTESSQINTLQNISPIYIFSIIKLYSQTLLTKMLHLDKKTVKVCGHH